MVDGARHMLESGEWVVPRVYGELYAYKPALAYWLASIPLRLDGRSVRGLLRLPFAAGGFAMGLAVLVLIGRLAGCRAGLLSAIASVTGVLFLQKSRMMEFDITLAAGVGVAVAAACFNLSAPRQRWGGLAARLCRSGRRVSRPRVFRPCMVFGPGILAAALASGRLRRLFGWRHLSAALVFTAICRVVPVGRLGVGGAGGFRAAHRRGASPGTRTAVGRGSQGAAGVAAVRGVRRRPGSRVAEDAEPGPGQAGSDLGGLPALDPAASPAVAPGRPSPGAFWQATRRTPTTRFWVAPPPAFWLPGSSCSCWCRRTRHATTCRCVCRSGFSAA